MPRRTKPPAPARRVFCAVCNIAPGIHVPYASWKNKVYCIPHARALVRTGEAEVAEIVLLLREKEQDKKAREDLFAAAVRERAAKEKTRTTSP